MRRRGLAYPCAALVKTAPLDVILLDAHYRQTVATMRVVRPGRAARGRARLRAASYSWAPALKSRWCSAGCVRRRTTLLDPDGYVDVLLRLVKDTSAAWWCRPTTARSRRCGCAARSSSTTPRSGWPTSTRLRVAVSKSAQPRSGDRARHRRCREASGSEGRTTSGPRLRHLGLPAVIKPEQSWVARDGAGIRLVVGACHDSVDGAERRLEVILAAGGGAVLQEWIPGRREAVQPVLRRRSHLGPDGPGVPPGVADPRWRLRALRDDPAPAGHRRGRRKAWSRAMDLEGCSMVEFRRDRHGQPIFMEINPRMGGSVALAISAGRELPAAAGRLEAGAAPAGGRRLRGRTAAALVARRRLEPAIRVQQPGPAGRPDSETGLGRLRRRLPAPVDDSSTSSSSGTCDPGLADMNEIVLQHAKGRLQQHGVHHQDRDADCSDVADRSAAAVDVAIVGAGPNGLGLAAHLHDRGRPVPHLRLADADVARHAAGHVPEVTRLRDVDPELPSGWPTFPEYCRNNELEDYEPIEFSTFAAYGTAFQQELRARGRGHRGDAPRHVSRRLRAHARDGEEVRADQVVVAVGLTYFAHVPDGARRPAARSCHPHLGPPRRGVVQWARRRRRWRRLVGVGGGDASCTRTAAGCRCWPVATSAGVARCRRVRSAG